MMLTASLANFDKTNAKKMPFFIHYSRVLWHDWRWACHVMTFPFPSPWQHSPAAVPAPWETASRPGLAWPEWGAHSHWPCPLSCRRPEGRTDGRRRTAGCALDRTSGSCGRCGSRTDGVAVAPSRGFAVAVLVLCILIEKHIEGINALNNLQS